MKVSKFVNMVKYGLLAGCLILSGDIELNPGPFDLRLSSHGKGLTIGQWNVQHLTDVKFEQLSHSFNASKDSTSKVDILILTETFCNDKRPDSYYQIQDYYLFRKDRVGKKGGGILAYVNNRLHAKIRPDLMENETEVL